MLICCMKHTVTCVLIFKFGTLKQVYFNWTFICKSYGSFVTLFQRNYYTLPLMGIIKLYYHWLGS